MFTYLCKIFVYDGYLCIYLVSSNQVIKKMKGRRFKTISYHFYHNSKQKDKQWSNSKSNEYHKQIIVWNLQDVGAYSKCSCICTRMYSLSPFHCVTKLGRKKVLELHSSLELPTKREAQLEKDLQWNEAKIVAMTTKANNKQSSNLPFCKNVLMCIECKVNELEVTPFWISGS